MPKSLRARFWIECLLSLVTGVATVATIINSEWIESLTGWDPDGGNGSLEWVITLVLAVVTVAFIVAARIEWRRSRIAASAQAR
jgi:hypothetical protein